jgi:hypothetical protein
MGLYGEFSKKKRRCNSGAAPRHTEERHDFVELGAFELN